MHAKDNLSFLRKQGLLKFILIVIYRINLSL